MKESGQTRKTDQVRSWTDLRQHPPGGLDIVSRKPSRDSMDRNFLPMDLFSISEKLARKVKGSICCQPDRGIGSFLD